MRIPEIKALAAKMMLTCLALIAAYSVFTVVYIYLSSEATRFINGQEMLESAMLATLLSLGGGILLDFEIRLYENQNNT